MTRRQTSLALLLGAVLAAPLLAQDPVRVGIGYRLGQGQRPTIVILPAPAGLDSVRRIIERDLDYNDGFEVVALPPVEGPAVPPVQGQPAAGVNYELYRALNAAWAVELARGSGGMALTLRLHDLMNNRIHKDTTLAVDMSGVGEGRMSLHRLSDGLVEWITGEPGFAASRILYQERGSQRITRVDSDGHGVIPVSPGGATALSPAWAPDGGRFAYQVLADDGQMSIYVQDIAGGPRRTVAAAAGGHNMTPAFSPDGNTLAFARLTGQGSAIFRAPLAQGTAERLTPARFPANLSPTWSPDGRRIAFVSDRSGSLQIYVMSADGTDQELLVPYDFGATGQSDAPVWSPDGSMIAFHRDVSGSPQIFVYVLASRQVRQLTSQGRNEDPSWAPDSRHIVYISDRTGRRQLHVIDYETARIRQIPTPGIARLPSWSGRLGGPQ